MQAKRVNTCLYPLIQLGSIGFSGRLTQPTPPFWGGGSRLLNRLAKTSQLGRCISGAVTGLWRGAAVYWDDELSLLGGAGCALQHGLGF